MNNHEKKHTFWKEHKDLFMRILDKWLQDNKKTLYYTKDEVYKDYTTVGAGVYDESEDLSSEDGYIAALIKWFDDNLNHGTYTNIVKYVCLELKISQKDLAELTGTSKPTVERWAQSGEVPLSSKKHLELLIDNKKLQNENEEIKQALSTLKKYS